MKTAGHAKRRYRSDPLSMYKVLDKLQPFTESEKTKLALPIRMAFEAVKTGRGTLQDLSDIGAAINTTIVRSESIGPECYAVAIAARDAMLRCLKRYHAIGKVGLDGPAISEVEIGIDLHEQLFALSTPLQMMDALREVKRRSGLVEPLQ